MRMAARIGLMILLIVGILALQRTSDRRRAEFMKTDQRPFVPPRPEAVKIAALGYHTALADVYWLQAIQFAADLGNQDYDPENLYLLVNFITDLDPRFATAYSLAGINLMLAERSKPEQIIAILEKGKKNCPDYWRIPLNLGFFYYFYLYDAEKAAENFQLAYRLTHYSAYALLATRMLNEAGSPELGIKLLMEMEEQTEDEKAKARFRERIQELQAAILERDLNRLLEIYVRENGAAPSRIEDFYRFGLERGYLKGVPRHPVEGHRWILDPEQKLIRSDPPLDTQVHDLWKNKKKT